MIHHMYMKRWKCCAGYERKTIHMDIKTKIKQCIIEYVKRECASCTLHDLWGEPIVGFADAEHPYIMNLKNTVHPEHQLPSDVMPEASIVIAYFIPFSRWMSDTNNGEGLSSPEWAEGYELTNAMFGRLNQHIINTVRQLGFEAAEASQAGVFYRDEVISHWSFRHFAYAAGLGTFGLNNMLITEKGCAGRCNTIVTDLDVEPDSPQQEEACLYKRNGSCGACVRKCPSGALTVEGFNRHLCYEQCLKNAAVYDCFGSSYTDGTENIGSEVCGKCVTGMPCTFRRP